VAFRAKEATREAAHGTIQSNNLQVLLTLLGVTQRDLRALTSGEGAVP
jgi:hypothetical protein